MSCSRNIPSMNLKKICDSGQCFRMRKKQETEEEVYQILAADRWLEVRQEGETFWFSCDEEEYDTFWREYFDADRDYRAVIGSIDAGDVYLTQAAAYGEGIRILRQDLWEMIVTFIISQQNHIRRIRKCIETVCEAYGSRCTAPDGTIYYAFPTPEQLGRAPEEELRACGLGYRSRYLAETARMILEGEVSLETLSALPVSQAREELLKLCGVGQKVADCICLFALHDLKAFPVDTHIRQVLEAHYPQGFPFGKYPETAGILQQYIFYYDLECG